MAGPVACPASRLPASYSGRGHTRLRLPTVAVLACLGFTGGGCAMSNQFGSLMGGARQDDGSAFAKADDVTGSIQAKGTEGGGSNLPPETDLVYARAAVKEVLGHGAKTLSAPWENPQTGARGTVTPVATSYPHEGMTCHDFLASYVKAGDQTWLQGEACRSGRGDWEVRSFRPWKRT